MMRLYSWIEAGDEDGCLVGIGGKVDWAGHGSFLELLRRCVEVNGDEWVALALQTSL